jgi:hypothetical protein
VDAGAFTDAAGCVCSALQPSSYIFKTTDVDAPTLTAVSFDFWNAI